MNENEWKKIKVERFLLDGLVPVDLGYSEYFWLSVKRFTWRDFFSLVKKIPKLTPIGKNEIDLNEEYQSSYKQILNIIFHLNKLEGFNLSYAEYLGTLLPNTIGWRLMEKHQTIFAKAHIEPCIGFEMLTGHHYSNMEMKNFATGELKSSYQIEILPFRLIRKVTEADYKTIESFERPYIKYKKGE